MIAQCDQVSRDLAMIVAFTGPSRIAPSEQLLVRGLITEALGSLPHVPVTDFRTGGAHGFDTIALREAIRMYPYSRHTVYVPAAPYNDDVIKVIAAAARNGVSVHVEFTRPLNGENPYRARNRRMVAGSHLLIAGLRQPEFYRSGEWMTVNMAREADVEVRQVLL